MAMNREQKRAMQRQGQVGADGAPVARDRRAAPAKSIKEERTRPRQFLREVRSELKKTSWPTRQETVRLAIIVFVAIVVLGTMIFLLDLGFAHLFDLLFQPNGSTASAAASAAHHIL